MGRKNQAPNRGGPPPGTPHLGKANRRQEISDPLEPRPLRKRGSESPFDEQTRPFFESFFESLHSSTVASIALALLITVIAFLVMTTDLTPLMIASAVVLVIVAIDGLLTLRAQTEDAKNSDYFNREVHLPTQLGSMMVMIMGLSGGALLIRLVSSAIGADLIPSWLTNDCLAIFTGAFAFKRFFLHHHFLVDPEEKVITYSYANPFYRELRRIPFKEIAAVTVTGHLTGWPLYVHFFLLEFSTVLILNDGKVLPLSDTTLGRDDLFSAFRRRETLAADLATRMNAPFLPCHLLGEADFKEWSKTINRITETTPQPQSVSEALWDAEMASISLESLAPGKVKVDLATRLEKGVLLIVTGLILYSMVFFLQAEWELLAANPRAFYLILLDSSSILITILGLWRWLIDEYYVIDIEAKEIRFFRRILFFRSENKVTEFASISHLTVDHQLRFFQVAEIDEAAVKLVLTDGKEILLSDFIWQNIGIPGIRAYGLSRLIGCRFQP